MSSIAGPNTRRCIELLLQLREQCRLVFIMGNHEEMMLSAGNDPRVAESWLGFGGRDVVESYDGDLDNVPAEHWDFLRSGREHFETDSDHFRPRRGPLRPSARPAADRRPPMDENHRS